MKGEKTRSLIESASHFDKSFIDTYAVKLKWYLTINIVAITGFFLGNGLIGQPAPSWLELYNVFSVITFIITIWRVRAYVAKLAGSLDFDPNIYYYSTMVTYLGVFLVYFHSFTLLKEYAVSKNTS